MPREIMFLSDDEVEALLDLDTAIASQRAAFVALGRGGVDLPPKIMHASRFDDSVGLAYLARMSRDTGLVAKIGSVNPGNTALGLPTVSAIIVALDPVTGVPVAVLAGAPVTTLRTAAASAVAVEALAVPGASRLGVLGSGVQARAHVRAIARVRPLETVLIWSPTRARREQAAGELGAALDIGVRPVDSAAEAVADMEIVATCTLSRDPVVRGARLAAGCTVVSVGSFEPGRREVDGEVIRRAGAVVVDDPDTAATHAGPVVAALASGDLDRRDLVALGAVLAGDATARTAAGDIVFFNSVGLGVQDAAAAWAVIDAARVRGAGR